MSATGDGDKALGGQESPVGAARVWAEVVGVGDPGVGDSEPHGDDAGVAGGDTAGVPDVAGDDASASAIVAGVVEGLGEEVVSGSGQDGSDIWQAEEGQGSLQGDLQPVDESLFLAAYFFFVLLELVHSLVELMSHDMLLRNHARRLVVGQWPHTFQGLDELPVALVRQMVEQYTEALRSVEESENEEEAEGEEETEEEEESEEEEETEEETEEKEESEEEEESEESEEEEETEEEDESEEEEETEGKETEEKEEETEEEETEVEETEDEDEKWGRRILRRRILKMRSVRRRRRRRRPRRRTSPRRRRRLRRRLGTLDLRAELAEEPEGPGADAETEGPGEQGRTSRGMSTGL
ncbi:Hydrocephalus-Inducing Protein-like [Manis pentadactyla]|nr:Hydrocephalus-Inducing Protein-like [Manis pentadactyla]